MCEEDTFKRGLPHLVAWCPCTHEPYGDAMQNGVTLVSIALPVGRQIQHQSSPSAHALLRTPAQPTQPPADWGTGLCGSCTGIITHTASSSPFVLRHHVLDTRGSYILLGLALCTVPRKARFMHVHRELLIVVRSGLCKRRTRIETRISGMWRGRDATTHTRCCADWSFRSPGRGRRGSVCGMRLG